MKGNMHQANFKAQVLSTIQQKGLNANSIIFEHVKDPKHTSCFVRNWLNQEKFQIMKWPPKSPYLNYIENVYNEVDMHLRNLPNKPSSKGDLWNKIECVWDSEVQPWKLK